GAGGGLARLGGGVLAAARLELGGTVRNAPALRVEPLELGPVLERAAARFRLAHPGRRLTVEAEGPLPAVEGDAAMLTRVLDNLLDNARKYSDGESAVALRARAGDVGVVVEIADRGIGIDPAARGPAFLPRRPRPRGAAGGRGFGPGPRPPHRRGPRRPPRRRERAGGGHDRPLHAAEHFANIGRRTKSAVRGFQLA